MLKKLTLIAIFFNVFFAFQACKKAEDKKDTAKSNPFLTALVIEPSVAPDVENGMLVFRDLEHLDQYMHYLDSFVININPEDTVDGDEKLDILEAELSYTSLRSVINDAFEPLNEAGWDAITQIPEDHYLHGRSFRSIFNAQRNVKIGQQINHLYDKDLSIVIFDGNTTTLDKVNSLDENMTVDVLQSIFALDTNVLVYNRDQFNLENYSGGSAWKMTVDTTWNVGFKVEKSHNTVSCNPTNDVYVSAVSLWASGVLPEDLYNTGDQINIYIDWGDGAITNTTATLTESNKNSPATPSGRYIEWPGGSNLGGTVYNHAYANRGSKTIRVKAKRPYHTTWQAEYVTTFDIPNHTCGEFMKKEKGVDWKYYGDDAVSCYSETKANLLGYDCFYAESEAWEKIRGKFRKRKAHRLVVQMWANVACGSDRTEAAWPYNDKHAEVRHTLWWGANSAFTYMNTNHRNYLDGSHSIDHDMTLLNCD